MEKYEEVLHHLQFAQELHKTLDGLTVNVSLDTFGIFLSSFKTFSKWHTQLNMYAVKNKIPLI